MTLSIEEILQKSDTNSSSLLLKKLADTTLCPICHDYMFVPYMTRCGHNFCYSCLTEWLSHNISCPSCRSSIHEEPFFNVQLRDLCNTLLEMCQKIANDELVDILRHRKLQIDIYTKDETSNKKFKNIFANMGQAVVDLSDGVARCSNCHWEVHGDRCPNCNVTIGNRLNVISDEDSDVDANRLLYSDHQEWNTSDDDDFESDIERRLRSDEPDEDDLAFVVDDDDLGEESYNVSDDEDDGLNIGRGENNNVPSTRRYTPTFLSDDEPWEDSRSFQDDSDVEDRQGIQRNSRFIIQSDSEDEGGNDAESWNGFPESSDVEAALTAMDVAEINDPCEADSDGDSAVNVGRRGRAIYISEDDDDD